MRGPALPTVVDVPRPLGLLPSSVDDVACTSVVDVDVASRYSCLVVMLRRHSRRLTPVCVNGCRHPGQLHFRLVRLSQCRQVALSYNRHSLPVPKQPW